MSPHARYELQLVLAFVLVCIATAALAALLHNARPAAERGKAWAVAQAERYQAHLVQLARERSERDYLDYVRRQCGDEAWPRPREGALPVCADKHGRGTGQTFTGVQP